MRKETFCPAPDAQNQPQNRIQITEQQICAGRWKICAPEFQRGKNDEASTLCAPRKKPLLLLLDPPSRSAAGEGQIRRLPYAGGWSRCATPPISSPSLSLEH